jgi:hypothetical protein
VGTCKHLGIDPFAYLREALPALFGRGEAPGEEALVDGLPGAGQERQRAAPAMAPTPAECQEPMPA